MFTFETEGFSFFFYERFIFFFDERFIFFFFREQQLTLVEKVKIIFSVLYYHIFYTKECVLPLHKKGTFFSVHFHCCSYQIEKKYFVKEAGEDGVCVRERLDWVKQKQMYCSRTSFVSFLIFEGWGGWCNRLSAITWGLYTHPSVFVWFFFFNILDVCVYGALLVRVVGERKGCQNWNIWM